MKLIELYDLKQNNNNRKKDINEISSWALLNLKDNVPQMTRVLKITYQEVVRKRILREELSNDDLIFNILINSGYINVQFSKS